MTLQDSGIPAIEGQKPIGEQRKKGLECPACRFKIWSENDHEPNYPNGDWDRQDVIDHIMRQSKRAGTADPPHEHR